MCEKDSRMEQVNEMFAAPAAKYRGIPFWSWNCSWLFVSHVWSQKQHLSEKEDYIITLKGCWNVVRYDALTSEAGGKEPVMVKRDATEFICSMYAQDSLLFRLEERTEAGKPGGRDTMAEKGSAENGPAAVPGGKLSETGTECGASGLCGMEPGRRKNP